MKKGRYLLLLIGILSSCGNVTSGSEQVSTLPSEEIEIENTVETWTILQDSIYETAVYKFTSNVPGKKVVIVGGIHGDEVAGWHTALDYIELGKTFGLQKTVWTDKRYDANVYGTKVTEVKSLTDQSVIVNYTPVQIEDED